MRAVLRFYLIALMIVAGTVRDATGTHLYIAAGFVLVAFLMGAFYVFVSAAPQLSARPKDTAGIPRVWAFGAAIIVYGLVMTVIRGYRMKDAAPLVFYFLPYLLFPLFALAFRSRRSWIGLLYWQIALACVVAVEAMAGLQAVGGSPERLMSEQFHNLMYFYGLIAGFLAIVLQLARGRTAAILAAAVALLLARMVLSGSRGEVAIFAAVVVFGLIMNVWISGTRSHRPIWVAAGTLAIGGAMLSFAPSLLNKAEIYGALLAHRTQVVGMSEEYRITEMRDAVSYAQVSGAGFGAVGEFGNAIAYTTSSEARARKSYVHELPALLYWKLGIVGLLMYLWLLAMMFKLARDMMRLKDPLLAVWLGLLAAWTVQSLVTMVFTRIDVAVVWASWMGGYVWYRTLPVVRWCQKPGVVRA